MKYTKRRLDDLHGPRLGDAVLRGLVISRLKSGYLVELEAYPIRGILNTGERFSPGAAVAVCVHRAKPKRQELKFKLA